MYSQGDSVTFAIQVLVIRTSLRADDPATYQSASSYIPAVFWHALLFSAASPPLVVSVVSSSVAS